MPESSKEKKTERIPVTSKTERKRPSTQRFPANYLHAPLIY
jgi:hypothetical protein